MKPWEYYSTPVEHPWIGTEEIERFRAENNLGVGANYSVANFIWYSDDLTKNELYGLEHEFKEDVCKELGVTPEMYDEIDPYDNIIGCPENHDFPGPFQFEEMYKYIKEKIEA